MKNTPAKLLAKAKDFFTDKLSFDSEIVKIDSLIGEKTVIEGSFTAVGNCKIDGTITGDIKVSGDLVIDKTAKISGDISARNVIAAGEIIGNITAKGQLFIKKTAVISGEHTAFSLAAEEGCAFNGNCKVSEQEV